MSYFPTVYVELLTTVNGQETWTNIGGDIVSAIKCNLGFSDGDPLDRLAPGSDMRFDLDNIASAYNPSASFYKGQKIRLRICYGSLSKIKFFGYIDHIGLDVGTWGARQAHVICIDWLALAAKTPVRAIPSLTNTTIDIAANTLIAQMQNQPEVKSFEIGEIILPSVFDQITTNSTIYSELQNLVMGEFGYIYMRDGGQTLKVESALSRSGDGSDYKTFGYYLPDGVATDFLLEDGSNFLLEDGTNFRLEGEPTAGSFASNFGEEYTNIAINHGDNLTNKISTSAVPTTIGGALAVLYPFDIANGSKAFIVPSSGSVTFQGQYKDPVAGGAQISGSSMVTPVVTTDWKFNSLANGTGTDLSANISISFVAGQSGFKAIITNSGTAGYITKFNVRGVPVYRYSPVETVTQDQRSIWDYGDYSMQFTRQYGQSSDDVQPFIFRMLMRDRKPRTIYSNPKFQAFDKVDHLVGFLSLDIGDQIRLKSTKPASDALYYIQGVKFTIQPGSEQITFDYVTAETLAGDPIGIAEAAIEQTTDAQGINFGYLPAVSNHNQRTICARVYVPAILDVHVLTIWGTDTPAASLVLSKYSVLGVDYIQYAYGQEFSGGGFSARARNMGGSLLNQWVNLVLTFDGTPTSGAHFYENNVALAMIYLSSSGTLSPESGYPLTVGNRLTYLGLSASGFVGKYENIAIYNRILSPAEITAIHNGGTRLPFNSYPKSGLKFFFGGMDNDTYADKLDGTLGTSDVVYDLQNGFTGQPIGNPTLRATG